MRIRGLRGFASPMPTHDFAGTRSLAGWLCRLGGSDRTTTGNQRIGMLSRPRMLRRSMSLGGSKMRRSLFLAIVVIPLAFTASPVRAEFRRIATIPFPGAPLVSFDIGWVNDRGTAYYLTDRSNARIDIFDARNNTYRGKVDGFVGVDPRGTPYSGPNGVLVVEDQRELWVSDGDSTIKVIDLRSLETVAVIDTGGAKRADEMAYDPRDHIFIVANNEESPPYLSFIDTRSRAILGTLAFPLATDGLEQPVWDRDTGKFLQAVPATAANPAGEIAVIDPLTMQLTQTFPIPVIEGRLCSPHGIDLGARHELLIGCSLAGTNVETIIMNASTGAIVKVFTEVGASDQVWFNRGDRRYYLAARNFPGGAVLGVIDTEDNSWVLNMPTAPNAHSVAASRRDDHVFVPLTPLASDPDCVTGCI